MAAEPDPKRPHIVFEEAEDVADTDEEIMDTCSEEVELEAGANLEQHRSKEDLQLRGIGGESLQKLQDAGYYMQGSSGSARSQVWESTLRLSAKHPKAALYTHQCVLPSHFQSAKGSDGTIGICGVLFNLKPLSDKKPNSFSTTVVVRHRATAHSMKTEGQKRSEDHKTLGVSLPMPQQGYSSFTQEGKLVQELYQMRSQMHYVVYGKQSVSPYMFDDFFYREMMRAHNPNGKLLNRKSFTPWLESEWELFKFYAELDMRLCDVYYQAPFSQVIHDGGTAKSHKKHHAVGLQYVRPWNTEVVRRVLNTTLDACKGSPSVEALLGRPGVGKASLLQQLMDLSRDEQAVDCSQVNLCLGFSRCHDATAAALAKLIESTVEDVTKVKGTIRSSIQDFATLAVSRYLQDGEIEEEGCAMHNDDKIGSWAVGKLKKHKNRQEVEPFPEGVQLMSKVHNLAKHFSYGERLAKLHEFCKLTGTACITPKLDLNGTRISAQYNLLLSTLRLMRGYNAYIAAVGVTDATVQKLALSASEWEAIAEFEAVLQVTKTSTVVAQNEKDFTGGYRPLLQHRVDSQLSLDGSLPVIDLTKMTPALKLDRVDKRFAEFSPIGKMCWTRASEESQRRHSRPFSQRELAAVVCDPRLKDRTFLSADDKTSARTAFLEQYVNFGLQRNTYQRQLLSASSKAAGLSFQCEKDGQVKVDSEDEEDMVQKTEKEILEDEAKDVFRIWKKATFDWKEIFNIHPKGPDGKEKANEELDLLWDLLPGDMSKVYSPLASSGRLHHLVPMALTLVGCNIAESFCEREIHVVNQVMTPARTLLDDRHLEMLAVLRMNREYMLDMRRRFPELAMKLNKFQTYVIRGILNAEKPDSAAATPALPRLRKTVSSAV